MYKVQKIDVTIKGICPLLQHSRNREWELKQQSNPKYKPTDEEQFNANRYYEKNPGYYQPATQVKAAMVSAAARYVVPGERGKTYADFVRAGLFIEPDKLKHKTQKVSSFGAYAVRTAGRQRNQIWVVRPRFDKWSLEFSIVNALEEKLQEKILKEILTYAGLYKGIGAWRPEYGRFEIAKWKVHE